MAKKRTYDSALPMLHTYVAENGLRYSAVRTAVLEQVCLLQQPFTAEQLEQACKAERISVGTVYNALHLFLAAGILRASERQRGQKATEYELTCEKSIRMQVSCEKCGRVTEFHDKAIERIVRARKNQNFVMDYFTLILYGQCKKCKQKQLKEQEA